MFKKKIVFIILTLVILVTCSIGVYSCYQVVNKNHETEIDFNKNEIIYDIFSVIYPVSMQLDGSTPENVSKYVNAQEIPANLFYQHNLEKYRLLDEYKNIRFYAEYNGNVLGNTTDDLINIKSNQKLQAKYQWYLMINFDEAGNLSYDSLGNQQSSNRNFAIFWNNYKQVLASNYNTNLSLNNPTNLTVVLAVPTKIVADSYDVISYYYSSSLEVDNIVPFALAAVVIVCLYALIYPYETEKEIGALKYPAKIKLEPLFILVCMAYTGMIVLLYSLVIDYDSSSLLNKLISIGFDNVAAYIVAIMNIISWMALLYLTLFSAYYIKSYFKEGFVKSFKQNTVLAWLFRCLKRFGDKVTMFDLNYHLNQTIIKIIVVNAVIISLICGLSKIGILFTIIYSCVLFNLLRKKFEQFQNDYQILLNAVKRISNGDFDVEIQQDVGVFNTLKNEFANVKDGFEKAVNEEVKSQKMKTELISNVSHDLKTPLTSIITYIDLLKNNDLSKEQQEYVDTLDRNALRLKNLIDDLFEVSKVNSGDVKLNLVDVDIVALIKQAKFELEDQFNAKKLTFKTNYPDEKIILKLDSSKTYRIFQNLLINIGKYALENTRVYIEIIKTNDQVYITFKNISANEIKISEDKLVERFVQGDKSRNTSGSGLGLSIAKSFTELQHGIFKISVDGDLFKAMVIFNLK